MQVRPKKMNKILTIPNLLSIFRLCLIPIFVWLYCVEHQYLWTAGILVLSGITDIVDGFIARHFNAVSDIGKILDPIADKLTQGVMLICLCIRFPFIIALIVTMALKEIFVGITGLMAIHRTGKVQSAKWHGKIATILLYSTMILHVIWYNIPLEVSSLLILICIGIVILSFVLYGIANIKAFKHGKKTSPSK